MSSFACSCGGTVGPVRVDADASVDGGALPILVEADACPSEREPMTGKVLGQAVFEADPDKAHPVAVWLRAESLPAVPGCPGDDDRDARCAARDDALVERQHLNVQELDCVLSSLDGVRSSTPLWYELPYHLTSGVAVPIGLAVQLSLTWTQIATLAAHPFVARIEPAPGTVPGTGFTPPPAPAECPTTFDDDPTPKLTRLTAIQDKGRQPTVIDVDVSERALPPAQPCGDDPLCMVDWERTLLNTRELTCLKRRVDAVVTEASSVVPYAGIMAPGPLVTIPPAGQGLAVSLGFSQGLTWDEALLLAAHPYVADIWTDDSLQFEMPTPDCPPDFDAAIPAPVCTDAREPIDGKFTDIELPQLEAATDPIDVIIQVKGGATICPLPSCSAQPCPERDQYFTRMEAENLASQQCVRDLITSMGGMNSPDDVGWLVNAFEASLTWTQIQAVAAYPDVRSIEPLGGSPPP